MKLLEAINVFFRVKLAKLRKTPSFSIPILNLDVIDMCNSRCVTCDIWKNQGKGELNLNDYRSILEDAKKLGVKIVSIGGGEPLMRKDLVALVDLIRKNGFSVHMNSSLISASFVMIDEMIAAGLSNIHVSIDHFTPEGYRNIRGVNSLEKVERNLDYILKSGKIFVGINVVISRHNLSEIYSITNWLISKKVNQINFIISSNNLQQKDMVDDYTVSNSDLSQLQETLTSCAKIIKRSGILTNTDEYIKNIHYAYKLNSKKNCFVGRSSITIDSYGNLFPCYEYNEKLNVKKGSVLHLLKSSSYQEMLNKVDSCTKACHDVGSAELSIRFSLRYQLFNFWRSASELGRFKK